MTHEWIIYQNHLAIDGGDNAVLHPSAEEIYSLIDGEIVDGIQTGNPADIFPHLRFSRRGSPVQCEVTTSEDGILHLSVFTVRKKTRISVDLVDGNVIDHCVSDTEWFFLTGDCQYFTDALVQAGIKDNGEISVPQYLSLRQYERKSGSQYIAFNINEEDLKNSRSLQQNVPQNLHAELYEYQKTGFSWMKYMLGETKGCILGDEMGLGKTLQVITVILSGAGKRSSPVLVIGPVSLLENWRMECRKFAPDLKTFVHQGASRPGNYRDLLKYDVVITSYSTAVNDLSMMKMITWDLVVLDEAQNIKNPVSKRTKAVKQIPRNGSVAVSGTPFENHMVDVWSIVDFIIPGLLGTASQFQTCYSDDVYGAEEIEPILSPLMLRRLVRDVASDLPEKVVIPQPLIMPENEAREYERIRQEILNANPDRKAAGFSYLQKLRMFCTFPSVCDEEITFTDPCVASLKYQRFCEIVEEIVSGKEKVLVFTSYKKMFKIFLQDIPRRFGIPVNTINGETPVEERQKIVDEFNAWNDPAMLLLQPTAAGTGLNITGANHVIHFNLEWNPAVEDQASARAYRRGQKKTVFVHRLYYCNTVEEVVDDRIERKREIAASAIIGNTGVDQDREDIINALNMSPLSQNRYY